MWHQIGKGTGDRQGPEKQIRSLEPGDKIGSWSLTIIEDGYTKTNQVQQRLWSPENLWPNARLDVELKRAGNCGDHKRVLE